MWGGLHGEHEQEQAQARVCVRWRVLMHAPVHVHVHVQVRNGGGAGQRGVHAPDLAGQPVSLRLVRSAAAKGKRGQLELRLRGPCCCVWDRGSGGGHAWMRARSGKAKQHAGAATEGVLESRYKPPIRLA